MMEWWQGMALMVGGAVALIAAGVPVAFAFLGINLVGVLVFMGGFAGIDQLVANTTSAVTTFTLVPVPLFLIMGELLFHSGLAMRVFDALDKCFGRLRGRLSYMTVGGGTLFATLSGSSMANTAMLGAVMVPEMTRRGYKRHLIIGPIIGTGALAMIIPPSTLAVLLGSLARIDVGALLLAGLLPGFGLAAMYVVVIWLQLRLDPEAAPSYDVPAHDMGEVVLALTRDVLPMGLVVFAVVGLILLGVATPTEAAAFGVLAVVLLTIVYRVLTWGAVTASLKGALKITAMTFLIILASSTFSQILAFSGASAGMLSWTLGMAMPPWAVLVAMVGLLVVLGMFMDQVSMMMLTLPVFMPLVHSLGFDPVWFGVVMLLALELSLATPPFGLLLFVMVGAGPPGTTLPQVASAAAPFVGCTFLMVFMLFLFPDIALVLPRLLQ